MDNNIRSSILQACKLARDLESNLPNHSLASLSDSCHHIIQAFSEARDHIDSTRTSHAGAGGSNIPSQAMAALFQAQPHQLYIRSCSTSTSDTAAAGDQSMQMQQPIIMDVSSSADHPYATLTGASSSSQRPRSRRKVDDKRDRQTIEVAAPEYGNTDIPPDDGFTWKKYGQKEILGCLFPRSYYRCTHQKLYNCPAKKQVQRLDSSPNTYQLTYRGLHTCHLSATAPAVHNNSTMPQWLLSSTTHHSVADMADAMFNSTTTNTIDLIFSSHHHSPPHINSQPDNKKD